MPTIFLSLRGDGAPRVLESFRRALGEEATSLIVVPTNDESGYHGSAEVVDVIAAREAFALARKPYPALKAFLGGGGGGGEDTPRQLRTGAGESRSRGPEQASSGGRRRAGEGRAPGQERSQEKATPTEETERPRRRSSSRGRGRGEGRSAAGGEGEKPLA